MVLLVLVAASVFTWLSLPDATSEVPVLYWATDTSPARIGQISTFQQWLKKNGHPDIEIRLDTVNFSPEKVLVQGVSGVAADLLDHTSGWTLRFRQAVGLLEDVTEDAQRLGFDLSHTFKAVRDEFTVDGRQYAFPTNVSSDALWVNVETFERVGMEPPPRRWTVEEFERIGKEYVRRANEPGKLQRNFFVPWVDATLLASTMGGAIYNETQSACVIDSPGYRRALGLQYKWTFVDRLAPTEVEREAFATGGNFRWASLSLFENGNYAMVRSGRWALVQFRQFSDERRAEGREPMKLAISEDPYGDFRNAYAHPRGTAVYAGGKHKELTMYFMAYLASDEYNMTIVRDADALPPNPKFIKTEEFLRPPDRPEEWQHPWGSVHEVFANIIEEIIISSEFCPFILETEAYRHIIETTNKFMNHMLTLEEATALMQRLINAEIQRSLAENPALLSRYNERLATQKQIDNLRARGEKVPLSWITNPYWRKYYTIYNLTE